MQKAGTWVYVYWGGGKKMTSKLHLEIKPN